MFRRLFPFRRLLATSFLLVFVNVFVGQCWCAVARPAAAGAVGRAGAPAKRAHACCQGPGKAVTPASASAPGKAGHAHKPGKHDCCKDKSAALLASLTTPAEKQFLLAAPALLPAAAGLSCRPAAGRWNRTGAVVLVPRQHLPPKIPDIRIYIQSLTV